MSDLNTRFIQNLNQNCKKSGWSQPFCVSHLEFSISERKFGFSDPENLGTTIFVMMQTFLDFCPSFLEFRPLCGATIDKSI